jgi:hypothetical protein
MIPSTDQELRSRSSENDDNENHERKHEPLICRRNLDKIYIVDPGHIVVGSEWLEKLEYRIQSTDDNKGMRIDESRRSIRR